MNEERVTELLVDLHRGLPRLGPGNAESTLRALALCEKLPAAAKVLDVGCGTGVQTLVLALAETSIRVTATDLYATFLAQLDEAIAQRGLENRIETRVADMCDLPFPDGSFDLVWSEGAIYIMGFDEGLKRWKPLVKRGGYLVVSEASWFRADAPQEVREFWGENYPAMRNVSDNLAAAESLGWQAVGHFPLPVEAWEDYYQPLHKRIPEFRKANANDSDAQAVADMMEQEMDMHASHSRSYGYEFYVLRRD